jgi:hypothetical protein
VARTPGGIAALRAKLADFRPDVLLVFGDDQLECFDFTNHPLIAVYAGQQFAGRAHSAGVPRRGQAAVRQPGGGHQKVPGHAALATHVLTGLMSAGFDPAFMLDLPNPDRGMSHAVMIPLGFFTDFQTPVVPILINAYYAPQISGRRSYQLGRAVRALIDSFPGELRVVVIGSGGLWHTPKRPGAWLNEEFDQRGLACLERGAIAAWAAEFDRYVADPADRSQDLSDGPVSGLPGSSGPQFGTRETLCWIAAAATVAGQPSVVLDYVPIYASPVGIGFGYCEQP